jgi:DNA-directed RNA polymerase specialized sigma24 family protein
VSKVRDVLVLHGIGYTTQKIAERTGLSPDRVESVVRDNLVAQKRKQNLERVRNLPKRSSRKQGK